MCPLASLDLATSIGEAQLHILAREDRCGAQPGYLCLGGTLLSLSLYRPRRGLRGKWRRHRLKSRSNWEPAGLSLEKVKARPVPGGGRHPLLA